MAEYRIPITMEFIGAGSTAAEAKAAAEQAHATVIKALCDEYGYDGDVLAADGTIESDAEAFARQQIKRYLADVVAGWARRKAREAAEAAVSFPPVALE